MKKVINEIELSRQQFKSWFEYFFSVNNLCIGLSNFLFFPAMVHEYRGGAFIIAYTIMLIAVGYPVLYLELIIGQFHRCSSIVFIRRCVPILQGFGYMALLSAITVLYPYQYMVARAFKFSVSLAITRSQSMPWSTCDNSWNTDECYEFYNENCPDLGSGHIRFRNECVNESKVQGKMIESAEEQYLHHVIHKTGSTHMSFSNFDYGMACSMLFLWLSIAIVQTRVGKLTTSLIYVPTIFIFLICPFLLSRALHLDGAMSGIKEMMTVEWAELLYSSIWMDALNLVIQSLSIGIGGHSIMSSFAPKKKYTYQIATLAVIADTGLSLIVTGTVYSILGFIRFTTGRSSVYDITVIPPGILLSHSTVPVLLRKVAHNAWLWVFLYYIALVVVGWKSCSLVLKTISVTLTDIFNCSSNSFLFDLFSMFVSVILAFSGLLLCFEGGPAYIQMIQDFQKIAAGLFITIQLLIVLEFYGLDMIYEDMYDLMGHPSINQWSRAYSWSIWKWRWRMAPALSLAYVVNVFIREYPSHENDLIYFYYYDFIQLFFILFLSVSPVVSAYYVYVKMFYHLEKIEKSKTFSFKTLWNRQHFLRSWGRIENESRIKQRVLENNYLPDVEPEDPTEFWKNNYLDFSNPTDVTPKPGVRGSEKPVKPQTNQESLEEERLSFQNYMASSIPENTNRD